MPKPTATAVKPTTDGNPLDVHVKQKENSNYNDPNDVVPFNPQDDSNNNFDLLKFLNDSEDDEDMVVAAAQIEKEFENNHMMAKSSTTTMVRKSPRKQPIMPNFNNCKIANIHFHIHKH